MKILDKVDGVYQIDLFDAASQSVTEKLIAEGKLMKIQAGMYTYCFRNACR